MNEIVLKPGAVALASELEAKGIDFFIIFGEEPGLASRFGESYAAYCRVTNRWIPRFPRAP